MSFANRFPPIFCYGKSVEKTQTDVPSVGEYRYDFDNSASLYTTNTDHVFVSDSAYASAQYVGAVLTAAPTYIITSLPLLSAVGASARIWQPTFYWRSAGEARVTTRFVDMPQIIDSFGTTAYSSQNADEKEYKIFSFPECSFNDDFRGFINFMRNYRRSGKDTVTIAWWDRELGDVYEGLCHIATGLVNMRDMSNTTVNQMVCSFTVPFRITADDSYSAA